MKYFTGITDHNIVTLKTNITLGHVEEEEISDIEVPTIGQYDFFSANKENFTRELSKVDWDEVLEGVEDPIEASQR